MAVLHCLLLPALAAAASAGYSSVGGHHFHGGHFGYPFGYQHLNIHHQGFGGGFPQPAFVQPTIVGGFHNSAHLAGIPQLHGPTFIDNALVKGAHHHPTFIGNGFVKGALHQPSIAHGGILKGFSHHSKAVHQPHIIQTNGPALVYHQPQTNYAKASTSNQKSHFKTFKVPTHSHSKGGNIKLSATYGAPTSIPSYKAPTVTSSSVQATPIQSSFLRTQADNTVSAPQRIAQAVNAGTVRQSSSIQTPATVTTFVRRENENRVSAPASIASTVNSGTFRVISDFDDSVEDISSEEAPISNSIEASGRSVSRTPTVTQVRAPIVTLVVQQTGNVGTSSRTLNSGAGLEPQVQRLEPQFTVLRTDSPSQESQESTEQFIPSNTFASQPQVLSTTRQDAPQSNPSTITQIFRSSEESVENSDESFTNFFGAAQVASSDTANVNSQREQTRTQSSDNAFQGPLPAILRSSEESVENSEERFVNLLDAAQGVSSSNANFNSQIVETRARGPQLSNVFFSIDSAEDFPSSVSSSREFSGNVQDATTSTQLADRSQSVESTNRGFVSSIESIEIADFSRSIESSDPGSLDSSVESNLPQSIESVEVNSVSIESSSLEAGVNSRSQVTGSQSFEIPDHFTIFT